LQVKTEPNIILGIEEVLSKYLLERGWRALPGSRYWL
jgi:hypothetical protein